MTIAHLTQDVYGLDALILEMLARCKKQRRKAEKREREEGRVTTIRNLIWFPFTGYPWAQGEGGGAAKGNDSLVSGPGSTGVGSGGVGGWAPED